VVKLVIGSPAADAGIEPRDIILAVNGVPVKSAQDALTRIANAKPGALIRIAGIRGVERFETEVKVGERPRN
jgi:S1-C subfamily serine protease